MIRLREAAARLRQRDPTDPLAYRLSRQGVWVAVAGLPPAEGGKTRLPPPPRGLVERIADLRAGGDFPACIEVIEGTLDQHIFWLDLNRLASETLSELGAGPAAEIVRQETLLLLWRFPGLERLAFSDGTPFADPATRAWLGDCDCFGSPAHTVPAASLPSQDEDRAGEINLSASLAAEGNLVEAIAGLQRRMDCCLSQRDRLQWRMALSRLLVEMDHLRLALPHLEQAVRDVQRYRLETYEPATALEVLKLAWRVFSSQADTPFPDLARETLHRIARLDAAEMIRLTKG